MEMTMKTHEVVALVGAACLLLFVFTSAALDRRVAGLVERNEQLMDEREVHLRLLDSAREACRQ